MFYLRNEGEISRLRRHFGDLVFNRANFSGKRPCFTEKKSLNVIEEKELEESLYTFRPQLDKLSMNIEHTKEELFGKVKRYNMLIQKGKEYKKKATEKKIEKEDIELEKCTFKPQINPDTTLQKHRSLVPSLKDSQDSLNLSK